MKKQIFAGLGLGILTGFIIGLSSSEVTGIILGALVSLLAAFFGLREKKGDDSANYTLIGAFGVFCVVGIVGGILTRTHKWLGEDINSQYKKYEQLDFLTKKDLVEIFYARELGIIRKDDIEINENLANKSAIREGTFNAGENNALLICVQDTSDLKALFQNQGGHATRLTEVMDENQIDGKVQIAILQAVFNILCQHMNE